jgi:hypothetical protein
MSGVWTTVGKSGRKAKVRGDYGQRNGGGGGGGGYKPRKNTQKTYEEPEWMKRNRLAREKHINPITGVKFNSAQELADDLYDRHYKTREVADLIAGRRHTLKCKKTGAIFTNEFKWRQHRVKLGFCPMAFCRCDCGSAHELLSHLMKKHRKPLEVARKMCFLKGAPVSQGFTAPDVNLPKTKDPMAIMLAKQKKTAATVASWKRIAQGFDPAIAEANHQRLKAASAAKRAVADEIKDKYKTNVDPAKYTIENLLKLQEKLRRERD